MMCNPYPGINISYSDIGQRTTPADLPIIGDPFTEISLELVFPKGNPIFLLNGKSLQLLQPLDRDEDNISHIVFHVCITLVYHWFPYSFPLAGFMRLVHALVLPKHHKENDNLITLLRLSHCHYSARTVQRPI